LGINRTIELKMAIKADHRLISMRWSLKHSRKWKKRIEKQRKEDQTWDRWEDPLQTLQPRTRKTTKIVTNWDHIVADSCCPNARKKVAQITHSAASGIQPLHGPVCDAIILIERVLCNVPHMLWPLINEIRHTGLPNLNLHHLHKHPLNLWITVHAVVTYSFGTPSCGLPYASWPIGLSVPCSRD
jgi:hypothetical protein